jgi:hypothetical protein
MKPYDMMSSFRGANTLFQGQQNKGRTDQERTQKRDTQERHRREIIEGDHKTDHRREIKGAT